MAVNKENHVFIEGNLTREPELRKTPGGTPVCNFAIAANRRYKLGEELQEEVSFFNVETWAALAENCSSYLVKGQQVRVTGRLQQDRWKNTEGQNRDKVKIVANQVLFGQKPKGGAAENRDDIENDIVAIAEDDLLKAV
jgi:single-strand DNA-binding protein